MKLFLLRAIGLHMQRENKSQNESVPVVTRRDWVGTLTVEILKETSPELAIKIAYDFAKGLRVKGAQDEGLSALLVEWVKQPFAESPLLPYIRAGFTAGFNSGALPWRRQIEAAELPGLLPVLKTPS